MFTTQDEVKASLPSYLQQFVVDQNYDRYTWQDHAVWRYIMRRNLDHLSGLAHSAYLEGLEKTGISIDRIPNIDEMNEQLSKIGWGAVVVDGFVPPAAFMEFQALKILVISAEMRNIGNILYTPAPDIVHEAAGHAPIIADPKYAAFLQRFGEIGEKAISSRIDYEVYEAIRYLSIIKEYPNATEEEVKKAEKDLEDKLNANTNPSEATRLSRLHWWTVEYGLVGKVDDFKLFGAGLLSSVGESAECLKPKVKKLPLTAEAANINYDITEMQPQLFVARDFDHLMEVLEEFADGMGFKTGSVKAMQTLISAGEVATFRYSSGIQVSSTFTEVLTDGEGKPSYIKGSGPSQLAYQDQELPGHGITYHADGFGSPVGKLNGEQIALEDFKEEDFLRNRLAIGQQAKLTFESGIQVVGNLDAILNRDGKNLVLTFSECTVTHPDGSKLFEPSWGTYDMAVGAGIDSVYSGSADKEKFNVYPPKSEKKAIPVEHDEKELRLFNLYQKVREIRDSSDGLDQLEEISSILKEDYPKEWLLRLEIYELNSDSSLLDELESLKNESDEKRELIDAGLALIK